MQNHYYLKVFLFLVLMPFFSASYGKGLVIDHCENADITLSPYLELLEDTANKFNINQLTSPPYDLLFTPNTDNTPSFGRTRSTVWSRFQLESKTTTSCFLQLDHPTGESVNAYIQVDNNQITLPALKGSRLPTYELKLSANQPTTVYIQVNNGKERLTLPFKLLSAEKIIEKNTTEVLIFSALLAGMFILLLYNILMYFSLKEKTSLILVVFIILCCLLFQHDSHLFKLLSFIDLSFLFDSNQYIYSFPITLAAASAIHYWGYISKDGNKAMEQVCKWTPPLFIAITPLVSFLFHAKDYIFSILLLLIPVLFILLFLNLLQAHKKTKDNVASGLILLLTTPPYLLMQTGLLEYKIIYVYILHSGVLLALLLLSFVQAEQTRRLREENERIEAISKSKDAFLTTMSHELRTPLHAITGLIKLLNGTQQSKEQQDCLNKLSTSSQHMQTLIDDILDLSKIEANRLDIAHIKFNLNEEIGKIKQIFSWSAKQKNITLYIQTPEQGLDLYGDPTRLNQVLANLLSNAVKYTNEGNISLIIRQQDCDKENYARIRFDISDTGIGISPEKQKLLFQPFFQSDNSYSRRYGGTGLGLTISQKLINMMGGEIKVTSRLDKGSQFFFTLDFLMAKRPQTSLAPPPLDFDQLNNKGLHILIVDDDDINVFLAQQMLEKLGIESSTANSGKQALQLMAENPHFDLIMMDVSMPEMDGYTACKLIRQQGHELPIIAVTAHAVKTEYEKSQQAGMDAYLTKPFDLERLYEVLLAFLIRTS
jgi:signal transduction histidine kinase